jgi:hypothetical protein
MLRDSAPWLGRRLFLSFPSNLFIGREVGKFSVVECNGNRPKDRLQPQQRAATEGRTLSSGKFLAKTSWKDRALKESVRTNWTPILHATVCADTTIDDPGLFAAL